jgi:hypothetical protein
MPDYAINNPGELKQAIIRALAFFDLFDHPLTAYEIWGQLNKQWPLADVCLFLERTVAIPGTFLEHKNGFYFLRGRAAITAIRPQRHNYSTRKLKIARRFARLFSVLLCVKLVALANSLGQNNLRDGSDIDFFIISSPRRVWLTRLYCTGLAKVLNRRPRPTDKKDKICLSFYAATDHLCLDDLRLPGDDPYFDNWRRSLVVLYNKDNTYEKFLAANGLSPEVHVAEAKKPRRFSPVLDKLEILAKKLQLAIMPPSLKSVMNSSDGVVVNDSILKLYQRDRRREYAEKYGNKVNEIIKENN